MITTVKPCLEGCVCEENCEGANNCDQDLDCTGCKPCEKGYQWDGTHCLKPPENCPCEVLL